MVISGYTAASSADDFAWRVILPANGNPGFDTNLVFNPAGYEMALATNATGVIRTYALEDGRWVDLQVRTPQAFGCGLTQMGFGPYLVDDARDGYMLLVDAFNYPPPCDGPRSPSASPLHVLTWKFQGGIWTQIQTQNAPFASANSPPVVAYDSSDGYVLLYGGDNGGSCNCETNRTWSYHDGVWTQFSGPAPTEIPFQLLFDPALDKILLISGGYWTFHAEVWERIFPSNPPNSNLADQAGYDAALHALVVGVITESLKQTIWVWRAGATGFVDITSATKNSGVVCDTASANGVDTDYDPGLKGLICQGNNLDLWEFS
jgi:hypothetical protein